MTATANDDLKQAMRASGVKFWQVAERYGCADTTFSRKLRRELHEEDKRKILSIIVEIKDGEKRAG